MISILWHFVLKNGRSFLLLTALVAVQVFLVCATPSDFWFEDDPAHRSFVRDFPNPLAYFGPALVSKLSFGNSVTPWFPFSFWIDSQFSALSPAPAYLHSACSLLLCVLFFFLLLVRFLPRKAALFAAALWLFLPSTIVVIEFLSTRHYLEGMLFSCIALLCCLQSNQCPPGPARSRFSFMAAAFYLLACSSKEVYVSATWFALLCLYASQRRCKALVGVLACGMAYAVYRLLSLGLVAKNMSFVPDNFSLFLARWPFIFSGNVGGYLLFALGCLLFLYLLLLRRLQAKQLVFLVGMCAVMVLSILPVTSHITSSFRELGSWYRVVFLLNSFMLAAGCWLVALLPFPRLKLFAALLAICVVLPGGWLASRKWDTIKAEYHRDASFYLQYPDRLLYSRLPAPWFLFGIHNLYLPGQRPHYLSWRVDNGTNASYVLDQLDDSCSIWVFQEGAYCASQSLAPVIRYNCNAGITPLHQGWP